MATFNKYTDFVTQLGLEQHNLNTDTIKVALFTPSYTPSASHTDYSALTGEVANGNGYTTGGEDANMAWSGGTATGTDIVWTATGTVSNIKHAVLYNSTSGKLIGYWTSASTVNLATGETFTCDFGANIFTIS